MPQIVHAIDIEAPVERVWGVLTDSDQYPQWNPLVKGIKGRLARGERVTCAFAAEGKTFKVQVEVSQCDGNKLVWVGPPQRFLHKLARGEHYFELVALEGGRTRLFHGERFTGLAFEIPWSKLEPILNPAYRAFNEALKERVESLNCTRSRSASNP
jgi:hypothetical protein